MFDVQVRFLIADADGAGPPLGAGHRQRLTDLQSQWAGFDARLRTLLDQDLAAFNDQLIANDVAGIYVP